jgi:glutamyl-tRNA synthetase
VAARFGLGSEEELRARGPWLEKVIVALRERSRTIDEMVESSAMFFRAPPEYDEAGARKLFTKAGVVALMRKGAASLEEVSDWTLENIEAAYRGLIEREGIKGGAIIHPTRLALTGKTVGPGLFEIIEILGKDESVARLNAAASHVEEKGLEGSKNSQ